MKHSFLVSTSEPLFDLNEDFLTSVEPVASFLLVALLITVAFGVVLLFLHVFGLLERLSHSKAAQTITPVGTAQIGYKKAQLKNAEHEYNFCGVTGQGYNADDDAASRFWGFHAYSSFADAKEHPQEGNVMLEVLLSGVVKKLELGFVATHQRVLQVIPHRCTYCNSVPIYFVHEAGLDLLFVCSRHLPRERFAYCVVKGVRFLAPWTFRGYRLAPIAKLPEVLPWMQEHRVVVGELAGKHKFVPTVLPGSSS